MRWNEDKSEAVAAERRVAYRAAGVIHASGTASSGAFRSRRAPLARRTRMKMPDGTPPSLPLRTQSLRSCDR